MSDPHDLHEAVMDGQSHEVSAVPPTSPAKPDLDAEILKWRDHWYPESTGANHPAPYLSGAWWYARQAVDDLVSRLKTL